VNEGEGEGAANVVAKRAVRAKRRTRISNRQFEVRKTEAYVALEKKGNAACRAYVLTSLRNEGVSRGPFKP